MSYSAVQTWAWQQLQGEKWCWRVVLLFLPNPKAVSACESLFVKGSTHLTWRLCPLLMWSLSPVVGCSSFLAELFIAPMRTKGVKIKLSSLTCVGEDAEPAREPALALRPGSFSLFFHFFFALPQLCLSGLSFLGEQEKALMAGLGLLSFPFD